MWISLNWIKRLADLPEINVRELADRVTISIAEVEGYEQTHAHLNNVYSAKILEIAKIPETDHLQVTKVDIGTEILQVVCGAPNIKVGDIVPLAKVGTVLPLDNGKTLKIKKGKLKGVESYGMLCSSKELKLSSDHGGIMMLPEDTPLDKPLSSILESDVLIEIDNKSITHRPDLWGHLGFAREISALLGGKLNKNYYNETFNTDYSNKKNEVDLKVTIEDVQKCRRYNGLVLKNIKITDSPLWIQKSLLAVGINPINNIVDATNFVMLELGQPMHAFDLEKLASPEIFVKYPENDNTEIKALDENNYKLSKSHLIIADTEKAIAVAGVIGGDNTKIGEDTKSVVLESANFHASTIRIGANKIGVRTDSSNRFEKSIDPEKTIEGIKLAYYIIKESCPEVYIASNLIDEYPTKLDKIVINISCDKIRKKLGLSIDDLSDVRIKEILTSLYFKISEKDGELSLAVPSFRATKDVGIDADIVEEIGRIYGYDNINPIPFSDEVQPPKMNKERLFERNIKNFFVNRYDLNEVYNYSFVSEDDIKAFGEDPEKYLGLRNYLSVDYTKIRRDLYISSLKTIKVNLKHSDYFSFFEIGRGYHLENKENDGLAKENRYLMATCYVQNAEESKDKFYEMKSMISELFTQLGFKGAMPKVLTTTKEWVHPYRAIEYKRGRDVFAEVLEFDPRFLSKNNVEGRAVTLKIDLGKLYSAKKSITKFTDLPKYPYSNFEVTVLADKKTFVNDILEIAKRSSKKIFKDIELLSIYEGDSIPKDKKSISIKVTIGDDNRTLKTKEIEKTLDNVIAQLKKKGFVLKS